MALLSLDVLFQGDRFRVSRKIINVQNLLEPIAFDEICVSTILLTEDHGFKVDIDVFGDVDNLNYSYPVAFRDIGYTYFSSGGRIGGRLSLHVQVSQAEASNLW